MKVHILYIFTPKYCEYNMPSSYKIQPIKENINIDQVSLHIHIHIALCSIVCNPHTDER